MKKNITIIAFVMLLASATYYLGYLTGARREVRRGDAQFRVSVYDALYHSAKDGDLKKIQSTVNILLLGAVRDYQHEFGDVTGTNNFARRYADAKVIADQVESTLVPLNSITNFLPSGVKLQIEVRKQ
jgi:hypothetical protein